MKIFSRTWRNTWESFEFILCSSLFSFLVWIISCIFFLFVLVCSYIPRNNRSTVLSIGIRAGTDLPYLFSILVEQVFGNLSLIFQYSDMYRFRSEFIRFSGFIFEIRFFEECRFGFSFSCLEICATMCFWALDGDKIGCNRVTTDSDSVWSLERVSS